MGIDDKQFDDFIEWLGAGVEQERDPRLAVGPEALLLRPTAEIFYLRRLKRRREMAESSPDDPLVA